uniref:hypothetical protein n=1 Tax=Pontibacter virosus TaxID=1765052 RepID=UPI000E300030
MPAQSVQTHSPYFPNWPVPQPLPFCNAQSGRGYCAEGFHGCSHYGGAAADSTMLFHRLASSALS